MLGFAASRLIIALLLCSAVSASEPALSAQDFLRYYEHNLKVAHQAILQGSVSREFVRFRGYSLIDYTIYKQMDKQEIKNIKKPLVFFSGVLIGSPLYSEFGGVSIDAYADNETRAHLNFQGRYFSDLIAIGQDRFYALCALSAINRCLLLGIGERW